MREFPRLTGAVTTRRAVVLAASAQIASPLLPGSSQASAQSSTSLARSILDRPVRSTKEFAAYFLELWETRIAIAFAEVDEAARREIEELAERVGADLEKSGDLFEVETKKIARIVAHLQNVIMRECTDPIKGIVVVTLEKIRATKESYCSKYPYCR